MGKKKNTIELDIQTTRHIFLGDLLSAVPQVDEDAVWQAVNDSDISFGNNADTLMSKNTLSIILDDEDKYQKKLLDLIPENVFISLGS